MLVTIYELAHGEQVHLQLHLISLSLVPSPSLSHLPHLPGFRALSKS